MTDGNKFKGKISLSGLKGSSSGFPSFRFSPESEEIQEVLQGDSIQEERHSESLPESPKPTTGDTSPIKEYLRKNWAHKWDKKSLSLDLDLKEKIIAAIEDKRKSIVSHFIPEEPGLLIPSSSCSSLNSSLLGGVTEHTGVVVGVESTMPDKDISSNVIVFDNSTQKVAANISQSTGDNSSTTSEEFEEIGLDYLANMNTADQMDESFLDLMLFRVGADKLQDLQGESPPLHSALPRGDARHYREHELEDEDVPENLKLSSLLLTMLTSVVLHTWSKYFLGLLGIAMFVEFGPFFAAIFWFLTGTVVTVIVTQSLFETDKSTNNAPAYKESSYSGELTIPPTSDILQKPQKSQGWMTEFEGDYDPHTNNIRVNRVVFVRLEGSSLYISYPNGKYRIPKRRLWSDPPLASDITFSRHIVYNISGSQVFIAPERLAKRRAWNKKYPIGIRLPKYCLVSVVSPAEPAKLSPDETGSPTNPSSSPSPVPAPVVAQTDKEKAQPPKYRSGNKEIAREEVGGKIIYLFSRTDREKDDWFRRFTSAAFRKDPAYGMQFSPKGTIDLQKQYITYMRSIIPALNEFKDSERREAAQIPIAPPGSPEKKRTADNKKTEHKGQDEVANSSNSSRAPSSPDSDGEMEKILTIPQSPVFLNAILGRIFFDFLRSPHWTNQVQTLIQKKLNYIKRPPFLGPLLVKDIDLGTRIPAIQRASTPKVDSQGLWVDLDLTYEGNLCVTLETKLDLMKLRKSPTNEDEPTVPGSPGHSNARNTGTGGTVDAGNAAGSTSPGANMFDSDADDSGESSEEEEYDPDDFIAQHPQDQNFSDIPQPSTSDNNIPKPSKGAKILRMAEKIANSNFVAEMKVVKKAVANIANTPLVLSVELKSCVGTFALNIPSPPTDRLWYGFRTNPNMKIIVKPKVGERHINLTHVTDFIKKKLLHEFQRVAVLPNMDDVSVPLMEFKLPTS